jgi:hypothetical protein
VVSLLLLLLLLLALLQMKGCSPEYNAEGNLIWRGLRIRIGMSYGMVSNQKPLNTGRADYFGMLPNGAARVMALATPGQVGARRGRGLCACVLVCLCDGNASFWSFGGLSP